MLLVVLLNIMITIFFVHFPIFYCNNKGIKLSKKTNYILGIFMTILSSILISFGFGIVGLSIPTVIITGLLGTFINQKVIGNSDFQKTYTRSLIVLLLFFFSSFFQLIPVQLLSIDLENVTTAQESFLNLFSNLCLLIILFVLYWKDLKRDFKTFKKNFLKNIDIGFKYWFLGLIIMMASNFLIVIFVPKAVAGNEQAVQELIKASPWISLISTGILAPIIEEITFRKTFRDIIKDEKLFILLSGIVFGGLHVVLSLNSFFDLALLVPYCSLGIAFGYVYSKTKNVFTSTFMHMFHNTIFTLLSIVTMLVILC